MIRGHVNFKISGINWVERMFLEGMLPIADWKTCASVIPAQLTKHFGIYKRKVRAGKTLPMHGTFGYDEAFFLEDTIITVLRRRKGAIPEEVIMSDSPYEYYSMWEFAGRCVGGKVLLGGLGLGILANLLILRRDVRSVTIVEIEPEIIQMVKPYLRSEIPVEVIEGDIFDVFPKLGRNEEFDSVIVDIWGEKPPEMDEEEWNKRLEESYRDAKMLVEGEFLDSQHLFWGRQKEFDAETVRLGYAWIQAHKGRKRNR